MHWHQQKTTEVMQKLAKRRRNPLPPKPLPSDWL